MDNTTFFAPAGRSSQEEIQEEYRLFCSEKSFIEILSAITGLYIVLNENRQIVYANAGMLNLIGIGSVEDALGLRPGEALGCIHSREMPGGCGTSESCSVCGAVNAIIQSQTTHEKSFLETRITTSSEDFMVSWDMLVTSSPLKIGEKTFYVLSLTDIANEKRRQALERMFFHDILNTAGSLNGLLSVVRMMEDPVETGKILEMSEEVSQELIDEINQQRQVRSAENGDLTVNLSEERAFSILTFAANSLKHNPNGEGKQIITEEYSDGAIVCTDKLLLQRVLVNMIKNALEATPKGGTVVSSVVKRETHIIYSVHNDSVIAKEDQLKIFQRSFSTKGAGRGLGTYSIKLITENYLKGKAGFASRDPDGTVFWIEIPVKGTPAP